MKHEAGCVEGAGEHDGPCRDRNGHSIPETFVGRVVGDIVAPDLSKETALAETLVALKKVYPDRWQEIWAALGKESNSDRIVAGVGEAAQHNPGAVLGGLLGAAAGAILGSYAPKPKGLAWKRRGRGRKGGAK